MSDAERRIETAIAGLEAQRPMLGDAADLAVAALHRELEGLQTKRRADADAQSLRQVTILVLDDVGSTSVSQHLDPEGIHAVMDGALARFSAIVSTHRGTVLQYAGDSLLAVFGAVVASEDDPEQAVRCGLALLAEAQVLRDEARRDHGQAGLEIRVGIHTGSVLLGGGVGAESNIRGIAVNVAARMEQTAPAGALRVSHDTYAQVRGMFDAEPQPPLGVKGVDEPIQSYLVLGTKPRTFRIANRGMEGVTTRMVGRDTELALLQEAFKRLFVTSRLAAITVVGEAGIGKSRLLYEFESWVELRPESVYVFRGRAHPRSGLQPYGLLRDIVAWRLQIADNDTLDVATHKLEEGLLPLFLDDDPSIAEGHVHLLGHLIGIDFSGSPHVRGIRGDPGQIRARGFHAAAQMFRRFHAREGRPVLLQLEDLHWADDASLDFLNHLAVANRDMPLLILGFARPTLFERRTDWRSTEGAHRRVDLAPLDQSNSVLLVHELLKRLPDVPASLSEIIAGDGEGNPFYMEELVKMLIDRGAIEVRSGRWLLRDGKTLRGRLPTTLIGVLQARLDGLPREEKLALQEASVIGHVFWDRALFFLDENSASVLPSLVDRRLTVRRPDAPLDDLQEYAFQHQILHQVTYDTVLKRMRQELHRKVALWLAGSSGARAKDFLGMTAEHFEHAGDTASAAEFHALAAEHAKSRFAHDAALMHVGRALALLDSTWPALEDEQRNPLRWRLIDVRERVRDVLGQRSEQRSDIETLELLADALDDNRRRAHAAWRRSVISMRTGDRPASERSARRAMELATLAGDEALRLNAKHRLASAQVYLGDTGAGRATAQEGLEESRRHGMREVESRFLNTLTVLAHDEGDVMGVLELTRQTLAIEREIGDRRSEAISLGNLGAGWMNLGEFEVARTCFEASLHLARANGDRPMQGGPLGDLSQLACWQGEFERARTLAQSTLDVARSVEARDDEAIALFHLGNAELGLGRAATALGAYQQSYEIARDIGHAMQHCAKAGMARVALSAGDLQGALRHVDQLLTCVAEGEALEVEEELTCHQVLASAKDERARSVLDRVHQRLQVAASAIPDAMLRRGFLENIPFHRQTLALYRASRHGD
jgi:class 3 adenylate cyclase/tetratricopeptide (TPR) repeat protein